jgi:hypothetical protein
MHAKGMNPILNVSSDLRIAPPAVASITPVIALN